MSDDPITPSGGGWLTTCPTPGCTHETWHHRRATATRALHQHRLNHHQEKTP